MTLKMDCEEQMSHLITRLEVQKRDKERVNVYLDGDYAFSVPLNAAVLLYKGQHLDLEKIHALQQEDETARAYANALHFLSFRARSCAEMERHLTTKKFPAHVIEQTLAKLQGYRYLDDKAFAVQWLDNRCRLNPKSAYAISCELKNKGIDQDIIDEVLEGFTEYDAAWNAVRKKLYKWEKLDKYKLKPKLFTFLGNRGFSYETTWDIFNRIVEENSL